MKHLYASIVLSALIPLLCMGGTSIAGTYVCSDPQGNEMYTDHNRPGCREITPTPPNDIGETPVPKMGEAPQNRSSPVPSSPGEHKRGAITERVPKGTPASYSEQDLLRAVASGNREKTELILRAGISANAKDEQGQSALSMAAGLPSPEIPRLLMTHGADVNSKSNDGTTPLMAAMMAGQKATARLLLRNGADANASGPLGSSTGQQMSMLFLAIAIGDVDIAKVLIEAGADLNATLSNDTQVLSPLTFALKTNQQDIARLLMDTKQTLGPLQAHLRQLEGRLTSLCKNAGENIYETAENVEGIYIHVQETAAGKAFGYYHEKDRLSSTYLSPRNGTNYRFWEMDAVGKAGVINHHRIEAYPVGKPGEHMIELKQLRLPAAIYGITWKPLTDTEDQRQGLYGDELKIFEVKTERVLAIRTVFFYAITETTVNASGETLPIPRGDKPYRFATCPNYDPGTDLSYPDLRPRDSYRFVSKVLRPKQLTN